MSGDVTCPFCGRDPFHYVDNGVGMEAVAVTCCELGNEYFRGARDAPEEVTLSWEEFCEIGRRLLSSSAAERAVVEARREALEEAAKVVEPTNGPPCDCITLHDDEWWMPHCDCRNGGDSDEAQSWCTSKNEARRISALSSVRGEGGDKQARPSGSAPISTDTKGTTK